MGLFKGSKVEFGQKNFDASKCYDIYFKIGKDLMSIHNVKITGFTLIGPENENYEDFCPPELIVLEDENGEETYIDSENIAFICETGKRLPLRK